MSAEDNEQGTVRYMRCASCGNMNPTTAPSCARCGKSLHAPAAAAPSPVAQAPVIAAPIAPAAVAGIPHPPAALVIAQVMCPKCHKSFPVGSKFCGFCGTPLAAAPPVQQAMPAPQPVAPPPPRPAV